MEEEQPAEEPIQEGVTAVLVMVNPFTWVAYLDALPGITAEGSFAHEAFRNLIKKLQSQDNASGVAALVICRVKLVRLSSPA